MDNINKKICKSDNDCDNNNICSFDETDLNHYCVSNNKNNLYFGCLNNEITNLNYIESNSITDQSNYKNCIDFSRRQKNDDGLMYNYMIFKPKKNIYIDVSTINIYLKCSDQILAIIPHNDYFNLSCDDNQENCTLESKDSLLNFIIQNSQNCNEKNIYLEVIHSCENEGIKKTEKIPILINNFNTLKINLKCPVDDKDNKFKAKCSSAYLDSDNLDNIINKKESLYNCKNPVYTVPRMVSNSSAYKKLQDNTSKNEIKTYDNKINEKIEDLKRLKAEKYIKLRKIQTGETITLEEANQIINKYSSKKLVDNNPEYWTLFENYDAAQYLFSDNGDNPSLKYYGKVYTINEAKKVSDENNQSFFVWYHNSYELDNFASKLYFIDIYNIENDLFDKTNWAMHDNVTTAILNLETYNNDDDNWHDTGVSVDEEGNKGSEKIKKLIKTSMENASLMQQQYIELIDNNLTNYDVNIGVLNNLNNKITTYGQAINMNNYETTINNRILRGLGIVLFFVFVIAILVLVYFNTVTAGKIKVFEMPKQ